MPALEPLVGLRVVADPAAIDRARWAGERAITVLRIGPDEAFAIGATAVEIDDPHAIVEPEHGFSAASLVEAELEQVFAHVEFTVPPEWPALVQGKVAGVPAKVLFDHERTLVVVQTAYADELEGRLW